MLGPRNSFETEGAWSRRQAVKVFQMIQIPTASLIPMSDAMVSSLSPPRLTQLIARAPEWRLTGCQAR